MLIACNFHYIREDFNQKHPSIFGVTPEEFRNQLEKLSRTATFLDPSGLRSLIEKGDEQLDGNHYMITFDDGLREQYELALPVLDRMGIPALFFVNTANFENSFISPVHKIHLLRSELSPEELIEGFSDTSDSFLTDQEIQMAKFHYNYDSLENAKLKYFLNFKLNFRKQAEIVDRLFDLHFPKSSGIAEELYMSTDQIRNLSKRGYLGSHAHEHFPLGLLSENEICHQINTSKQNIERTTGKSPFAISYPYGSLEACMQPVAQFAKAANFVFGFTMERAINRDLKNPLYLSRFDCNDLPGGKHNLFGHENPFTSTGFASWSFNR